MGEVLRIPKTTGTHADVLTALGLADLLQSLFEKPLEVRDEGALFSIALPGPLPESLDALPHSPRYPWLQTGSEDQTAPKGATIINLSEEFQRVKRWFDNQRKNQTKRPTDPGLLQSLQQDAPIPRWWVVAPMTPTKLKAVGTWNRVAEAIIQTSAREFRTQVKKALAAMAAGRPTETGWPATSNGLFCPAQIKGFNELKPQGTSRGSTPVDAFEEWLRYQGYWKSANVVSDSDNIRVYIPSPMRVSPRAIERLSLEMEKQPIWGCGPKSDALAVIALARLLIEHSEEYHAQDVEPFPGLSLQATGNPANLVSGLYVTNYAKTSRQAYGVQSIAELALPGWFSIASKRDAEVWLAILDEHQKVIRRLQDDRSDEISLLVAYRRLLEKRGEAAIWSLVEFMEHYGPFLIRAREQKRKVRSFRTDLFRRIVMETAPKLMEVLNDSGFQAVATAVRKSTVSAQAQKAMGRSDYREIRYDLLHDLRRKRSLPGVAPLIETVSDFISKYNAENARRREMRKSAPRNITTDEFSAFTTLVESYGASTVGALLCAYGSCREPHDEDAAELSETDPPSGQPISPTA